MFRLPIDRVFTVKGFGTVVTGTVLGRRGPRRRRARGDPARTRPPGCAASRSTAARSSARSPACAARAQPRRPSRSRSSRAATLLVHPARVAPSHILDVELRYLRHGSRPARPRAPRCSSTTARPRCSRTLAWSRATQLAPGQARALAQLRIDATTPLGALPGDHFIVRGFVATATYGSTIGGGDDRARARAQGAQGRGARRDRHRAAGRRSASISGSRSTSRPRRRPGSASPTSCTGSAFRPPRSRSRSPRSWPRASCWSPAPTRTRTTSTRPPSSSSSGGSSRCCPRIPTGCRARSSAPSSRPRCLRAATTRSSAGSRREARSPAEADRVRKEAAGPPRCLRSRRSCSRRSRPRGSSRPARRTWRPRSASPIRSSSPRSTG